MVAFWYVNKIQGIPLSPEIIEAAIDERWSFVDHGVAKRVITDELYVNSYDEIARHYGIQVYSPATIELPTYRAATVRQEILVWSNDPYIHATGSDGQNHVTYDPLGYSYTVFKGRVTSKVVLNWGRYYDNELFNPR